MYSIKPNRRQFFGLIGMAVLTRNLSFAETQAAKLAREFQAELEIFERAAPFRAGYNPIAQLFSGGRLARLRAKAQLLGIDIDVRRQGELLAKAKTEAYFTDPRVTREVNESLRKLYLG